MHFLNAFVGFNMEPSIITNIYICFNFLFPQSLSISLASGGPIPHSIERAQFFLAFYPKFPMNNNDYYK